MKKNKPSYIYRNGKYVGKLHYQGTRWSRFVDKVKRFFKTLLRLTLISGFIYGVFMIGGWLNPKTIEIQAEVIKEVEMQAPVLSRIADCESGVRNKNGSAVKGSATHYKNGQVLVVGNKNGSVDIGIMQINSGVWGAKATAMGLNLMIEEQNIEFGKYLYKNFGTEPWVFSKGCWNR